MVTNILILYFEFLDREQSVRLLDTPETDEGGVNPRGKRRQYA
jgi:hypothetical protein